MINSTNTVNIDGVTIKEFDIKDIINRGEDDNFSRWIVRPLAVLAAIGIGVAAFFTSAMLIIVSLALLPILALAMWAMRTKLERELKSSPIDSSTVVDTDDNFSSNDKPTS